MVGRRWPSSTRSRIYSSPNLKDWTHLSDFGPANAVGGVWECPDLFPLAVDGNPSKTKWVMVVNLNPGGIAGGSAAQYFVGDFDGTRFTADDTRRRTRRPPVTSSRTSRAPTTAPGRRPAPRSARARRTATLPGQQTASPASSGNGLVNSFHRLRRLAGHADLAGVHDQHATTSTSSSAAARTRTTRRAATARRRPATVLADFEGADLRQAGRRPATSPAPPPHRRRRRPAVGERQRRTRSSVNASATATTNTGTIISPDFTIDQRLPQLPGRAAATTLAGGPRPTAVNLVVDGDVVRTATGQRHRDAQLDGLERRRPARASRRRSRSSTRAPAAGATSSPTTSSSPTTPAKIRSDETAVNLLVDGEVVRSTRRQGERGARLGAAGTSRDLEGKTRADPDRRPQQRRLGPHPRRPVHVRRRARAVAAEQRAQLAGLRQGLLRRGHLERRARRQAHRDRLDEQLALRRRDPDLDPWRSAMSVPRELGLRTIDGQRAARPAARPRAPLAARPDAPSRSATGRSRRARPRCPCAARRWRSRPTCGSASAKQAGLKVRTGNGEETVIGYDAQTARALRRPHPVGRVGLQPRLPRRPASPARRPPRQGPPAHPRRLVLGRGLRRRRPARDHRPDLPQRRPATGSSCSPTAAAPRWTR